MARIEQLLEEISKKLDVLIALAMPTPAELEAQEPAPDPLEDPPEAPGLWRYRLQPMERPSDLLLRSEVLSLKLQQFDAPSGGYIVAYRGYRIEGAEEIGE
ncbi:hypothetical protein D3C71_1546330 [compost metagenome]